MQALVIGASGGIGAALLRALRTRGPATGLSRSADGLDVTDEARVADLLGRLQPGAYDTVLIATGALDGDGHPPEKALRSLTPQALAAQFAVNAIGPALLLKHCIRLLPRDRPARVGVLSARVGSIGDNALGGWYSYRAAKAALNQLVHTASIEVARTHPLAILACLHPGTVATAFTAQYAGSHATVPPDTAAANLLRVLGSLSPADSGCFRDWSGAEVPW